MLGVLAEGETAMVYAIFMLLVLATLAAQWRGARVQLPLYLVTVIAVALFLLSEMTTPLRLSF